MFRSSYLTRTALGAVLALGIVGASPAVAKEKEKAAPAQAKITLSKPAIALYNPTKAAIDNAAKRPDVIQAKAAIAQAAAAVNAARTKAARDTARTGYDAAVAALGNLLSAEKAQLEQFRAAGTTPDDKMIYGQLAFALGKVGDDRSLQRTGLAASVESGKLPPEQAAEFNYFVGALSYDMRDYAAARTALSAAQAAGYAKNDIDSLLAEAFISEGKAAEGLAILQKAVTAKGAAAPEDWLRRGEVVAYQAKLADQAGFFGSRLVAGYPTTQNWGLSIAVLRDLARYPSQDMIDLLRLMDRTKSYMEARDYIEYIQAADPRRSPGEVMKIINAGVASGKLTASDQTVSEARTIASGRVAADKASLAGLERDARAGAATATIVMAAADAYLSYDQPAKAAELYQIALGKPGIDTARALTRLGIAQVDMGQTAAAIATFAKIEGARKPMAALWTAYANSKTAAAPAAQ
ncbi:hypothetical protein B0I00_0693 [Novosphingobium kunmingense]|uniref:Tetratricopeptide repeat protein n=1 Tax=Novosphingobium kunmingense TaxID=1211806 RepID=A0A2N0I2U3_9SPHN|nr:hypothetical protein [Novosphingobium kunmingense]PKB25492.1 hypothetical protein B0I00_0693 [Novosphingobium kunmingense]